MDWIFRNELLSSREDDRYVDYVRYEAGAAWSTPAERDMLGFRPRTAVQQLVIALHRRGTTSRHGLEVLADTWAGQVIEDETQWPVVADLNAQVLAQLDNDGAALPDASDADTRRVISQWTFPLHSLDLTEIDVKIKDLQELRERHLAAGLWDVKARKQTATLTGHTDSVWGVAFSPDGKTLATGSGDHTVRLWRIDSRW